MSQEVLVLHGIKKGSGEMPAKFNIPESTLSPHMLHKYGQMHEFWRPIKLLRRLLTAAPSLSISQLSVSQIWGKATVV